MGVWSYSRRMSMGEGLGVEKRVRAPSRAIQHAPLSITQRRGFLAPGGTRPGLSEDPPSYVMLRGRSRVLRVNPGVSRPAGRSGEREEATA